MPPLAAGPRGLRNYRRIPLPRLVAPGSPVLLPPRPLAGSAAPPPSRRSLHWSQSPVGSSRASSIRSGEWLSAPRSILQPHLSLVLCNRVWSLRAAGPSAGGAEAARFEALRGFCVGEPLPSEVPGPSAQGLRHPMIDTWCPAAHTCRGRRSKLRVSATARIRSRRFVGGEARWCTVLAKGNQEPVLEFVVCKC